MTINITSWKFVLNSILDLVFQIKRTFVTRVWSFRCQSFADADIIASASKCFDFSANTPATIVVVRFIMSAFTAILKKATNKNTWVLYNNPPLFLNLLKNSLKHKALWWPILAFNLPTNHDDILLSQPRAWSFVYVSVVTEKYTISGNHFRVRDVYFTPSTWLMPSVKLNMKHTFLYWSVKFTTSSLSRCSNHPEF